MVSYVLKERKVIACNCDFNKYDDFNFKGLYLPNKGLISQSTRPNGLCGCSPRILQMVEGCCYFCLFNYSK